MITQIFYIYHPNNGRLYSVHPVPNTIDNRKLYRKIKINVNIIKKIVDYKYNDNACQRTQLTLNNNSYLLYEKNYFLRIQIKINNILFKLYKSKQLNKINFDIEVYNDRTQPEIPEPKPIYIKEKINTLFMANKFFYMNTFINNLIKIKYELI